jgi:plasmid maintenance system antidote protein VapI
MSYTFWLRLQTQYDLEIAEDKLAVAIRSEVRVAPRDSKSGELKPAATA